MIALIVAVGPQNVIGHNGKLPWGKIKADMDFFKAVTEGSTLIMGKYTYLSIGRPLPNRTMFVVSKTLEPNDHIKVFPDVSSALSACETENVFFAGGETIYREGAPHCTHAFITMIGIDECEGDTFFPDDIITSDEWSAKIQYHQKDEDTNIPLYFYLFEKETHV